MTDRNKFFSNIEKNIFLHAFYMYLNGILIFQLYSILRTNMFYPFFRNVLSLLIKF